MPLLDKARLMASDSIPLKLVLLKNRFVAAFQYDFFQSLHLALFLRYAERIARRQIKILITTAMLGAFQALFRAFSERTTHQPMPRAQGSPIRNRTSITRDRHPDFPQERGPIQRGSKVSFDESTFNIQSFFK
jgi:hypothetical protein